MLNKTDYIASLEKGLRVLECFVSEHPRLSISDVAHITSLDRATARRCLLTLSEIGYCDFDGKFFTLTPRVLRLGVSAVSSLPLPQVVQPWLDQLSEKIGQSCSVSILDDNDIVYVARAAQRRVMSIGLMPGSRLPAHCTSMGRILLSALPEQEALMIIERSDLTPRTTFSLTEPAKVMAEVAKARQNGYALVDQEVEIGLRSLAVPIRNSQERTVAALNVGVAAVLGPADDLVASFLPELLRVQSGLKKVLR